MSGKIEKHDTTSANSKVLQKAKSFRDDIKHRIIRRSPSSQRDKDKLSVSSSPGPVYKSATPNTSAHKASPKGRKKISRGSSFKEESKTEKFVKHTDIEKLNLECKKVHNALHGLHVLVEKNMLHMLPGSATLVLETVMELSQFIGNFLIESDSTLLLCAYKQLYQSLSNLVQWSDEVLLQDKTEPTVCVDTSKKVIQAIDDGVKELMKHATEKLENKSLASPYGTVAPRSPGVNGCKADSKQRSSLPDIPLTPREKEILETTGEQLNYSNNNSQWEDEKDGGAPPPKPPLPANFKATLTQDGLLPTNKTSTSQQVNSSATVAPPLPPKKRSPSTSSLYDNHNNTTTSAVDHLWNESGIGGISSSSSSSSQNREIAAAPHYNPADILRGGSLTGSQDSGNSCFSNINSSTNNHSPTSTSGNTATGNSEVDFSPGEFYNQRQRLASDEITLRAESVTDSASIMSRSRHSNNSSSSDVNSFQSVVSSATSGSSGVMDVARLSQYDNFENPRPSDGSDKTKSSQHHEIQSLTQQIHELTANMDNDGDVAMKTDSRPPLPNKKNAQKTSARGVIVKEQFIRGNAAMSQYDNFPDDPFSVAMGTAMNMTKSSFFSSSSSHSTSISAMKTSHSAFEFSTSSSSSSSSGSSVSYRQVNATSSFTKAEQMAGGSPTVMRAHRFERKQAAFAMAGGSSVKMRSTVHGNMSLDDGMINPPPLPPKIKKKTVEAYMEMFGQYTTPNYTDLCRHSLHAATYYKSQYQQHQLELFHPLTFSRSNTLSIMSDISSGRGSDVFSIQSASSDDTAPSTPPFPPKLPIGYEVDSQSESSSPELRTKNGGTLKRNNNKGEEHQVTVKVVDEGTQGQKEEEPKANNSDKQNSRQSTDSTLSSTLTSKPDLQDRDSMYSEASSTLDDADVSDLLIRKKQGEEDPDIRGGTVDALIVHATTAGRKEIMYQEAFVTTYRTFIKPRELIEKLLYRYHKFSRMEDIKKKKLSRNSFSLLIRVSDELCTEIDDNILKILMDLVYQLLSQGELMLAKILRRKVLEKVEQKKQMQLDSTHHMTLWESHHMTTKQYSLLEFKPETIAEQMTLLDSELFHKIEIPEVLLWAKDQNEEQSPNLTKFTEHFNKMSYWCRTQILQQEDPKDREKYLVKFIKVMKFLRKYNNFNSYLAILSALDSAPIRRLDWQKQNADSLKELSMLIDSTASFKAYRLALGDTEPPCIPYIGIILQDLTFVHIGNSDNLAVEGCSNIINFAKRWQQFNILDNMKRFKKCEYEFKKNHKILAFFNGFEDSLSEESLWQISEAIKPRGGRKKENPKKDT